MKGPNLTNVSSVVGTKFCETIGSTAGALKDFSMFSTAFVVTSRFHLPRPTENSLSFLVTV